MFLCGAPMQAPSEAPKYQALTQFFEARRVCSAPTPLACPNDCSGSGDCVADLVTGAGVCSCYYGFSGPACTNVDSLDYFDCGWVLPSESLLQGCACLVVA